MCVLCVILVLFILLAPSYGVAVRRFFAANPPAVSSDSQNLAAENEVLKAQLAQVETLASEIPTSTASEVRAMVYSNYPFDFKNELVVDAGSDQGVAAGDAVLFQGVFIGQVQSVLQNTSVVETVFDDGFKMPVRIGGKGYDGLLQGGPYPRISSIAKNAALQPGDIVFTAGSGMPYGLPVGEVNATSTSADSLFEEAALTFAYDINAIQTVVIQK